jgi:hypothetical protein
LSSTTSTTTTTTTITTLQTLHAKLENLGRRKATKNEARCYPMTGLGPWLSILSAGFSILVLVLLNVPTWQLVTTIDSAFLFCWGAGSWTALAAPAADSSSSSCE